VLIGGDQCQPGAATVLHPRQNLLQAMAVDSVQRMAADPHRMPQEGRKATVLGLRLPNHLAG